MNPVLIAILSWVARLGLGGVYLVAGGLKVAHPAKFAESVANYRMLPHEWLNLVAITLPWVEITAGLFLIFGLWLRASAWLINAMTVLFIGAISLAVARGLNVECGCFGTVGGRRVGLTAIGEDLGLLLVGVFIVWAASRKSVATATAAADPAPAGPA